MRTAVWTCLLSAASGFVLPAQDITGNIGGTILDPSGTAVPNAKVTVTNSDRNQVVRTILTDNTGSYSAPLIPAGVYSIKVQAAVFKTEERTGIVLNVADDLRINIRLQVGAASETIEVRADAVIVELGSQSASTTIDGTQVTELALGARNYEELMALMPGVASNATDELFVGNSLPGGAANAVPFAVNGSRTSANNWTVDGADNVDRGSNLTLQTFPSVDAISQFKVERGLYSADTGRAGGAQINVVTKGGVSRYHGGMYEFFRNDVLNANSWTNNANRVNLRDSEDPFHNCSVSFTPTCHAKAPPVRWNDFGYTIGGPVALFGYNKRKNRTFFFFSQEFRKIINYSTFNPTLPTRSMLSGKFIQPVCITTTAGCPSGSTPVTQIPANLFNPNSVAYVNDILSKLPLLDGATTAATTAGFFPVRNIFNSRQEIGRIDHRINERFNLWSRFTIDDIPTTESGGLFGQSNVPNMATTRTNSPGRGVGIHVLNTISQTIVNDAGFNFSQSAILTTPAGLAARVNSPDIHPPEPFANPEGVVPSVTFSGGSSINGAGPYVDYNRNYHWFDNLTWVKGRHTLKFGFSTNRYNKTENANNGQGTFNFTNTGTPGGTSAFQQAFANFLLGNVATFSQPSTDITPDVWAWQSEAYAQDDFKVLPRLTLYIGVRWSYYGQPTDTNKLLDNFDPAVYDPAKAPRIDPTNGTVVPGTSNWQLNGIIVGGKNSRFGDKIANDNYRNFAPRLSVTWDPFGKGKTSVRTGYAISYDSSLYGTYEQNIFADPPYVSSVSYSNASFSNVTNGTAGINPLGPQATSVLSLHATQIPANVPYTQQWSFNIQQQLPKNVFLEVGYFGSRGTHLLGIVDLNEARPGAALAAGLHQANGNTIFTSTDQQRINAVRPYQGFGVINALQTGFSSNYHSLQMHLRKNFRGGGLLGVAYTFAKTMTNASSDRSNWPQNTYNWAAEYGPASFDRSQVLTINYVYTLPSFRRGRGVLKHALGGWEISGIVSTYTGQPVTVTTSNVDPAGLGLLANGNIPNRPDQICNANANAPHQYGGSAQSSAQKLSWFDTSCFASVPQGQVRPGNEGRYTVRGPGFFNWDGSILKNFSVAKDGRWKIQLRGESFNTLNWVNPSSFASTNTTATNFGQIGGFRAARRVQLGAKINF